jgi:hypothetical protein
VELVEFCLITGINFVASIVMSNRMTVPIISNEIRQALRNGLEETDPGPKMTFLLVGFSPVTPLQTFLNVIVPDA